MDRKPKAPESGAERLNRIEQQSNDSIAAANEAREQAEKALAQVGQYTAVIQALLNAVPLNTQRERSVALKAFRDWSV